jgi:Icc-related predicted phosphoesterase
MASFRTAPELRILCISDHVDPLVYSLNARERFRDVDLVLSAGDLNMSYLGFVASTLNRPVLFVFGNHNLKHFELFRRNQNFMRDGMNNDYHTTNFFGSTYVGDRVQRVKGLIIAGLGGSIRYNDGKNQFTDFQMQMKCLRLIPRLLFNRLVYGRYLDLFLTHSPPLGLGDRDDNCHRGFKSFRWFLRMFKPRYMLHGHIHLYDQNSPRHIRYGKTDIINVYDHYVLDFPRDHRGSEAIDEQ